jgi:hypothetical protein
VLPARIWADFNKTGGGRLELTTVGTLRDLERKGVELRDGLVLTFFDEDADEEGNPADMEVEGVVRYDPSRRCWAASYDPAEIRWVPASGEGPSGRR